MYTNKELASALKILNNECRSQRDCNQCPLNLKEYGECAFKMLDWDRLTDEIIDKVGERDG